MGSAREWALMVGLGVVPTVCGHSLLNAAMRRIRGQIVSLCNVSQFVFAGVMGYFLFGEIPKGLFYAGQRDRRRGRGHRRPRDAP